MPTGTVKCFNTEKGFGFIAPDDRSVEILVHYTGILSGSYCTLKANQRVQFTVLEGEKGPQAQGVKPI